MKALCIRSIVHIDDTLLPGTPGRYEYESGLEEGQWYTIYGIWAIGSKSLFLIHRDESHRFPILEPSSCFDVPVGCIPSLFQVTIKRFDGGSLLILSSQLFAKVDCLYEHLLECHNTDPLLNQWGEYKKAIDADEICREYASLSTQAS